MRKIQGVQLPRLLDFVWNDLYLQALCSYVLWQLGPWDPRARPSSTPITSRMHQEVEIHIVYKSRTYFTTFSNLRLNISKTTYQILTNLTVLENIDKTTIVDLIADILRPPTLMLRQPQ